MYVIFIINVIPYSHSSTTQKNEYLQRRREHQSVGKNWVRETITLHLRIIRNTEMLYELLGF
jgi:hypothetical protein